MSTSSADLAITYKVDPQFIFGFEYDFCENVSESLLEIS